MKIDVIAHIHALPGKETELREVLEGFVAPTRAEEGCIRYDLFVDTSDPTKFTFIEEWASREAWEVHGKSAHITAGREKFPALISQPNWVQALVKVA